MDLAWLLRGVSSKPESYARERDAEDATQSEGQQQCSPSQLEAGWSRSFHQSDSSLRRSSRPSQGASHLCQNMAGCPTGGFVLISEWIPLTGGGTKGDAFFHQMEQALMRTLGLTRSGCYKFVEKKFVFQVIFKAMNIQLFGQF